jgi:hypothetical protein
VDQFESNCSCSGIERRRGDEYVRAEELRLKPGEEIELRMRISVRGVPVGAQIHNGVKFRTNDPGKPIAQIEGIISRVTGGVFVVPDTIVFGSVPQGEVIKRIIDVRDDAVTPRILERVTSSHERVRVRILETNELDSPPDKSQIGRIIAQIEVTIDGSVSGGIEGLLDFYLAGNERTPDQMRVIGRIIAPVEISPSKVILPRSSSEGMVYRMNFLIRSNNGKPLSISVVSCPTYLTTVIISPDEQPSPSKLLTVTLDPHSSALTKESLNKAIRLSCRNGETESEIEIPVLINQ